MKYAKAAVAATFLTGVGFLLNAFIRGNFREEGRWILKKPWGQMSLADIYIGLALFAGWIAYREESPLRAALWIATTLIMGNPAASLYALIALYESDNDWRRFWMGARA